MQGKKINTAESRQADTKKEEMSGEPDARTLQSAWGIPCDKPIHGTSTTSHTVMDRQGSADALDELGREFVGRIEGMQADRSHIAMVDDLSPRSLAIAAVKAVKSLPEFADGNPDLDVLTRRFQTLNDVESDRPNRATRDFIDAVDDTLNREIEPFRNALNAAFQNDPCGVMNAVAECREMIKEYLAPDYDTQPALSVRRILSKINELPGYEADLLPGMLPKMTTRLLEVARQNFEEALNQTVAQKCYDMFQSRLPVIEAFLKEVETRCVRVREKLRALTALLERNRRVTAEHAAKVMSSVSVRLEGPSAEEVIAGMRTAGNYADNQGMFDRLFEAIEGRLREYAVTACPHLDNRVSLAELILEIDEKELAVNLDRVFEASLGPGHSLYQAVGARGIGDCIEQLWKKAGRTCFFGGANEHLGMSPDFKAILRLPPARTTKDEEIRNRVKYMFEKLRGEHHVEEGGDDEQDISLTRIWCGFLIGTEAGQAAGLHRYYQADREGHVPHLIGILPDSPSGEITNANRVLYELSSNVEIEDGADA